MTKDELIEIYTSKELQVYLDKNIPSHIQEDLKQYCFLELLQINLDKINKGFVFRFIWNTFVWRKRSKFWQQIEDCKPIEPISESEPIEIDISGLTWYESEILKLYAEFGSLDKVSENTQIPKVSIYMTVKKARQKIKSKL